MKGKAVTLSMINLLTEQALTNERKRKNYDLHEHSSDPINRMLNAFEPGTYCAPHQHQDPNKREVFIILRGRLAVVFFSGDGEVIGKQILEYGGEVLAVEIPPGAWHTAVSLESGTAVYEIKDGPYIQELDKNFAPWAPLEGDDDCDKYLAELLEKIGEDVTIR